MFAFANTMRSNPRNAPVTSQRLALVALLVGLPGCRLSFTELNRDADANEGSDADEQATTDANDSPGDAAADATPPNAFAFSRRISFRNAGRPEAFVDMPVLIHLTDTAQFSTDGNDLRFFDSNDQPLAYEIESWGPRAANVWVRVPRIEAASDASHIFMRYGSPGLPAGEDPAAVWSAEFSLVMHFGKRGITDSTGRNTIITSVDVTTRAAGTEGIGGSGVARFAGTGYIRVPDHPSLHGPNLTISAKVTHSALPTSPNGWAMSVARANGISDENDFWLGRYQDNCRFAAIGNILNAAQSCSNFSAPRYEAAVLRNTGGTSFAATFFLDATQAAQYTAGAGDYNHARPLTVGADTIGASTTPSDDYLTGFVDEVRVETVARSVHWLSALTAMDSGTFVVFE